MSNGASAVTTTSRASTTLRNVPSAMRFVAPSTRSHHDSGERVGSTVNRHGGAATDAVRSARRRRCRRPRSRCANGCRRRRVRTPGRHDERCGRRRFEGERAERNRSTPGKADVVFDFERAEHSVDLIGADGHERAIAGEARTSALEVQRPAADVEVGVDASSDGFHCRDAVISCAIPRDRATRRTSVNPASRAIANNASVSGR